MPLNTGGDFESESTCESQNNITISIKSAKD